MNLPTSFTLLRIFISPLFPVIYLGQSWLGIPLVWLPFLLLILLIVSECTDLLDGILARRRNQVTDLGKVLDPMADTITHISIFLSFTQSFVQLPLWIVFAFLYRDLFVSTLRTLSALRGVALAARFSGKVKAVLQGCAAFLIVLLMIPYSFSWISLALFQQISLYIAGFAALYTIASTFDYIFANWSHIKRSRDYL